jgi:sulfite oxidase
MFKKLLSVSKKGFNGTFRNITTNTTLPKSSKRMFTLAGFSATLAIGAYVLSNFKFNAAEEVKAGKRIEGLKEYTSDEVSKHASPEKRIWVTFQSGVYDITDFIAQHPGGEKILLAAGGPVDPFWQMYANHYNPDTYAMIEKYRIGNLKESSRPVISSTDPYANEPSRLGLFRINALKPFNAEPPLFLLVQNYMTPNEIFFVRNHLPVPLIDAKTWKLEIRGVGLNGNNFFSVDDLKTKFPIYKIVSVIQCAGNRRAEMHNEKNVKGLEWVGGAIGNAEWTGVRLIDVLNSCGLDPKGIEHVQFEGADKDPTNTPYGASIPFGKVWNPDGDVLLAFQMNGVDIPRDHGFPVRVIVPGTVGARNVKWISRIITSHEESKSFWQQNDYKGFSPSVDFSNADFKTTPAIQELPVNSQICDPFGGTTTVDGDGNITIKGYAYSGGGSGIAWVDVSVDGGKTWHVAKLPPKPIQEKRGRSWSWQPWEVKIRVPEDAKEVEIISKAVDDRYNTQPESILPYWNIRGVLTNAWSRTKVKLD